MEGIAYVPLHPKHPIERTLGVIAEAELQWVLDSGMEVQFKSVHYRPYKGEPIPTAHRRNSYGRRRCIGLHSIYLRKYRKA